MSVAASSTTRALTRILLAESEPDTRNALMWCLATEGYAVEPVSLGVDAALVLQRTTPDLAIIDLALQGLDGRKLVLGMLADPRLREVPILATARSAPRTAVPDEVAFLRKPVEPELVLQVVRVLLARESFDLRRSFARRAPIPARITRS